MNAMSPRPNLGGDPALQAQAGWAALLRSPSNEAFLEAWLALTCGAIDGVRSGHAAVEFADGGVVTQWGRGAGGEDLARTAARARARGQGVVDHAGDGRIVFAYPILVGTEPAGAVALRADLASPQDVHRALRALQWSSAWVRERILGRRLEAVEDKGRTARLVVDLVAAALEGERLSASARLVATELARALDCVRVSVGLVRRRRTHIVALSHSANFGKDMNLVRLIGEAMDEAVDQRAIVTQPVVGDAFLVTRAHAELAREHGAGALATVPLHVQGRFIGALTLERAANHPFTPADIVAIDAVATAIAPLLADKLEADRWLGAKLARAAARQVTALVGKEHAARKLAAIGTVAVVAVFAVWQDTYRVTADAQVEGRVQRSVVVSFNGFLKEAPARAGDIVKEGALLAALDDRDLVLERLRWVTERQRRSIEHQRALAERSRADTLVATSLIDQAEAQINLVDEQLGRTRLTAPFDGIVVSGDHSQSIGAAVQRGQVLFEVAPLDGYRVMLNVDEQQIADLREGMTGRLVLTALPAESFPVEIVRLTPVARAEEGRNVFRVEAKLPADIPALRPGMRGAAKIDVDRRHVAWIWARSMISWVRLALWRWIP